VADKIKVNLDAEARFIDGEPINWQDAQGKLRPCPWSFLAYKAVATRYSGEESMDFEASRKRAKLAKKLQKGGDIELTDEQSVEMKRLFAKRYDPDYVAGFAEALGIADTD
jgi:hypothetical protein